MKFRKEDIIALLPTEAEIEAEAKSFNHNLASADEAFWMPKGFKEGAEWVIKNLKCKLSGNKPEEIKREIDFLDPPANTFKRHSLVPGKGLVPRKI
jgi:hypothetical protein